MQLDYLYKEFMQDRKIYCTNQTLDFYDYYIPRFLYWLGSNELSDLNKHKLKEYILSMRGTMKNTLFVQIIDLLKLFVVGCIRKNIFLLILLLE